MYRNNGVKPIHPGPCVSIVSHGTCAIVQPLITAARTKGSSILRNLIPDTYSPSMPKTEKEMRKAEQKHPRISSRSPTKISFSSTFRKILLFLFFLFPLSLSLSPFSPSIPINVNNAKRNEDDTSASIVEKGSTGYAYAEN